MTSGRSSAVAECGGSSTCNGTCLGPADPSVNKVRRQHIACHTPVRLLRLMHAHKLAHRARHIKPAASCTSFPRTVLLLTWGGA
jgi:hypothetical protein